MKEIVLVILWFVSGNAAKHAVHLVPAHILCPNVSKEHDILLPDPHDCSVYYKCENGLAIPESCPIGLEWCKILSECTLPILANCTIKHTVVTYSPEELATYKPSGTPKPPKTPSPTYDICLINGARIPDYFDCNSYYECKKNTPTKKHCPPKKSYSCWYGSCVDQKQADCILDSSQEGKKCAKNGAKLGHPDDCTKYYECKNKKVVTKSCESGLEFNAWFLNCYEPNLAYCNKGTTIKPTTPTIGTTPTPSSTNDICPIPGATLPDPLNCNSYYQCEDDKPVLYECPLGLEYSCWDQKCLSPVISECANSIQENDTCTGNGTKLANPDECHTYFECEDGVILKKNCDHTLEYNQWFKLCLHPDLAHCKRYPNTTTTEKATSTPKPSETANICPIDGAKLPNPQECNSYYQCKGEIPSIHYCPDGFEYSCWDQECLPDESANCFSQNNQTGQPCNNNGDKLPNKNYCSSYYECIDGKIEIQYCESDFEYNQWYGSCMKPSLAHCKINGSGPGTSPDTSTSTEPESTPSSGSNPTVTEKSTSTSSGTSGSDLSTTTGASSSTEPETTTSSSSSDTPKPPKTPSPTYDICLINGARIPDYFDCNSYYECKKNTPTKKHCPPKKSYSCWYGSCVDQKQADCILDGSQEGKKCAKNGAKLGHPDDCTKYYECKNKKVVTKSCESGLEFNAWFLNCYEPNLAYCNKGTTIKPTTPTIGTTPTPSSTNDICPIPGATLPDPLNCNSYYQCEDDKPVLYECPLGLEYSCWDQKCLSPVISECANSIQENDTCTGNGTKLANPDECHTYFECEDGVILKKNCDHTLEYNQWFKLCVHPDLAHCKRYPNTTTTEKATSTPKPSETANICPIDGAKLPNPQECNSYYQCKGEIPSIHYCPDGFEYSCWDQECLPDESANCFSQNNQTGQPCNNNGDKLPNKNYCSSYYECIDGKIEIQYCESDFEYNQWYGSCMKPSLAHCKINGSGPGTSPDTSTSTEPESTPSSGSNPTVTEKSTSTSSGTSGSDLSTTTGASSSTEPETTTSSSSSDTPKPPKTPSPTYDICLINGARIPDYFDCNSYYECKKNTPTKKHCPPKKSYSCWYGSCVDQKQADCILDGSQEGKKCAKNGAKLGHPDDCTKYYECKNKKVVTKSCESGLEFNAWFLNCYEPNLAYCNKGTTIKPTTPTIGTTPTPSSTNDICPIPGATLPDPLNCNSYYQCEDDKPVLYECPLGLEYSCWDQKCLSPVISECANSIQENDTCTGNGTKLANPDECHTYFECEDGVILKKNCDHTLEYNQWFKLCVHPDLAHCKRYPNTTTTEKATSTPKPSETANICPIDGAKLPNPQECNSYYQCKGEIPSIHYCPDGFEYSCWDQECLPDESANCFSQNNQTGQPCNNNGDKLPNKNYCSSYYECIDGKIEIQYCESDFEYNQWYGSCMKPSLAHCKINGSGPGTSPDTSTSTEPESTPSSGSNPTVTEKSTSTSSGTSGSDLSTTTGASSSTEPETTTSSSSSDTPKPPKTPSPTYDICLINGARIPDYFDCNSYYECKKNTPTKKHCPPKKSYSCWYGSCVDQKQADCILDGSQEGKKCAKNGAKLGHPDDCTKYYECKNKKVVTKSCESGLEFNAWFLNCYEPNLAYCNKGTTIKPTTPTIGTTPTPSSTNDICPIPGATLPDPVNCNSYYQCEKDRPVLYECPPGLEYSCWDQKCLSPVISECANSIQENDTCTGNGTKLANPDECHTYFECKGGIIQKKNCDHTLEYNQWFKLCLHPDLAHCKRYPNTTTTEKATSTPKPSETANICPIDGAKLPNPQECNSYYQCKGEIPSIHYCPDGFEYSCWDQECLPDESANCFSQNNQTGQPCNNNGDKLPNKNYCSSYYECIDGKIEIQYCESDFEYNQWYESCMKPSLAHCKINGSGPGTSPSSTEPESTSSSGSNPTVTEKSTSTSSSTSGSELSTTTIGPSLTEIICPHNDVTLPNPTNCSLFYQCVNGTQTVKQCNTSEEFSSWLGQCVDTNTAICIDEGSIEGELCSVNGEKLQYPQNCGKYYECVNNSAVLKSCPIGEEFNVWFGACYEPKYAHCHNYSVIQTPQSTEGTTVTLSPIINICTENGYLLPNLLDCRSYYECQNNTPIEKICPENLYYSCWDLQCLPKSLAHCFTDFNTTDKCSDGDRLPNPNNCNSYYECINGKAKLHHCNKSLDYNAWNKTCVHPSLSHCVSNNTDTTTTSTTGKPSSTPPPSEAQDICPIEGSNLPNLQDCGSYYQCQNNKPELKNCTSGYIYSCWDQVCLPALTANCLNKDTQEGQACPTEGEKLPNAKNCRTFYQCVNRKVRLMSCEPGLEFNSWYQICTSTSLAWCHTYPPIGSGSPGTTGTTESTSSTLSSNISPSPIFNICPINGATLPNELNCKSYYECQDQLPVPKQCPSNLAYDCWEQKCTAEEAATCINQGNQTGHSCSNNGDKLPNINSCTSYYQCVNGIVHIKFCADGQFFNQWFGICVENTLAHCQTNSADTTTDDSTTITPSTEYDICPIDNALLPNPIDCSTYYRCEKNSPVLQTCELGFAYSCWDQKCVPAADADCIAEGSQQDKNCSKAGQRLPHIEDCNEYYECKNGKVITKKCLPGTRFNKWFGICLSKSLAHCEPYSTLPPPTTTSHPLTTFTPSATHDICPINGSLLPNPSNCSSYYICENGNPTIHYCDKDLEYSCWDQVCLPPSKANCIAVGPQTGKNCSKEGQKTQNPDNCHTYYQCVNGNVETKFCPSKWYYNKWFRICSPSLLLSHCKIGSTPTTLKTTTTIITTTAAPSEIVDICPIEGALLPAPMNCNAYYKCVNQSALIQHCPTNEEYSCWDQICKPATDAECINSGEQVGKKCSKEGEKLQDPATCSSYYQCLNGVVERQYCFPGFRYNKWYGHCVLFFLSHCEINPPSTKPTTEHTMTTFGSENTPGPSPIKDICPIENALLPNPANCSTYYRCQNNTPILQLCADGLEYSCWDQTCLPTKDAHCIAVGSQEGLKCSRVGKRLPNTENCYSYFECRKGKVVKQYCAPLLQYNKWYSECKIPKYAHCQTFSTKPTTTTTTTYKPPTSVVCQTNGAKVPNPKNCKQYFVCDKGSPALYECPPGYSYDCWNEACNPTSIARCVSAESAYVGDKCTKNGRTIPNVSNCNKYYECVNGKIAEKKCGFLQQYSVWGSKCTLIVLAKCAHSLV